MAPTKKQRVTKKNKTVPRRRPGRPRRQVARMRDLLIDTEDKVMADDQHHQRVLAATEHVVNDPTVPQRVKDLYAQQVHFIHNNRVQTVPAPRGHSSVSDLYNVGFIRPTADEEETKRAIVEAFNNQVAPHIRYQCRVSVLVGSIMDKKGDPDLPPLSEGGEQRGGARMEPESTAANCKYFAPDYNSSIYPAGSPRGETTLRVNRGGRSAMNQMSDFVGRSSVYDSLLGNRPNSQYSLSMHTNVTFRVYKTMAPVVGGWGKLTDLPPLPLGLKKSWIYTPSNSKRDKYCIFACLKRALKLAETEAQMCREYVAKVNIQRRRVRTLQKKQGREEILLMDRKHVRDNGLCVKESIYGETLPKGRTHAEMLEKHFECRLFIYVHDPALPEDEDPQEEDTMEVEAAGEEGRSKLPLVVLPLHVSQLPESPKYKDVHLLLTGGEDEAHAHWIKKPAKVLEGCVCSACGVRYNRQSYLKRHVCKPGGHDFFFPGGPAKRRMSVWETMAHMHLFNKDEEPVYSNACVVFKASCRKWDDGAVVRVTARCVGFPYAMDAEEVIFSGPEGMDHFLDWAAGVQKKYGEWWRDQISPWRKRMEKKRAYLEDLLKAKNTKKSHRGLLPALRKTLVRLVTTMGRLPILSMPDDIKSTSAVWDKRLKTGLWWDGLAAGEPVYGSSILKGQTTSSYRCIMTSDGLGLLPWSAYEDRSVTDWKSLRALTGKGVTNEGHSEYDLWAGRKDRQEVPLPPDGDLRQRDLWDVQMLASRVLQQISLFTTMDSLLDIFHDNMSLPGLARQVAFSWAAKEGFHDGTGLFFVSKGAEQGARVHDKIRRNVVGGPSWVYEQEVTDCQVLTYDANSLYAWCLQQDMPCGRWFYEFLPQDQDGGDVTMHKYGGTQSSLGEFAWLNHMQELLEIEYMGDSSNTPPANMRVTGASGLTYIPDGMVMEEGPGGCLVGTKVVFEYLGDYWHRRDGITLADWEFKKKDMEDAGYTVHFVWESDFKPEDQHIIAANQKMFTPMARAFALGGRPGKQKVRRIMSEPRIFMKALMDGYDERAFMTSDMHPPPVGLFGFAEVDVEPRDDSVREKLKSFPPLFTKDDKDKVCNGMAAERVLLFTPCLARLVSLGLVVSRLYSFWEFRAGRPFAPFIDFCIEGRRNNPNGCDKLFMNTTAGSFLMNQANMCSTVRLETREQICRQVEKTTFIGMNGLEGGPRPSSVHVTRRKRRSVCNTAVHIGKAILDLAKSHMMHIWHNVLYAGQKEKPRLVSFDTDAFTFVLPSGVKSLAENSVWGPMFWRERIEPVYFDTEQGKRTRIPGRLHLECSGVSVVALGKKFLAVRDKEGNVTKLSHRGIRREALPSNPYGLYYKIFTSMVPVTVEMATQVRHQETGLLVDGTMKRTIYPPVARTQGHYNLTPCKQNGSQKNF